jgi:hypothetical protein
MACYAFFNFLFFYSSSIPLSTVIIVHTAFNINVAHILGKNKKFTEGRYGEWNDCSSIIVACCVLYFLQELFNKSDESFSDSEECHLLGCGT